MMASFEVLPPQAIVLIGVDAPDVASTLTDQMRFRVSLDHVSDVDGLFQAVAMELVFPHDAWGLDALLDLMSDSDWFGSEAGYVVEFDGLDQLHRRNPELLARFVSLFPNLCDRWRSSGIPFRLVLRCQPATRGAVREAIDTANAEIEKAALLPWLTDLAPAAVIECVE